ncbi:hypothetical protein E2F46_15145 [Luteimonas aestuarii]|uniref:Uncharacterized protein n=1 Tax=Luteimonas aestuarii TaxID=453837 RepID=A0A4V6PLL5_9GAMM|nr:hypothetical protein [Luteimonas aestuarii]TDK21035.1 hypothetical protein E2F46_15145 [Luteimonas aestuarii]
MRGRVLAGVVFLSAALAAESREPPAPHCADARAIEESWQSDERTLVLRLANDSRYRVDLGEARPAATTGGELRLLTHGGWLCGHPDERVRAGEAGLCRIAGVQAIDAKTFAGHARQARLARGVDLDHVTVSAPRSRRFSGSPSFCLDARHVRSWHEDGDGLVVEVSPRRSGGYRRYRVELTGTCPGLVRAEGLRLESSLGSTTICGNPGDRVVPVSASIEQFAGDRFRRVVDLPTPLLARGCPVQGVYPLERD